MRTLATWAVATLIGLVAVVGLIAFLNSRDKSQVDARNAGPGALYRGRPALSPTLRAALRRGNVVVLYRAARPSTALRALVPAGGRALEPAGQAVVLDRVPTLNVPLAAVSATRIQAARQPQQLADFIDYWLGGR